MRTLCAAVALLVVSQAAWGGERLGFLQRLAALPADQSLVAFQVMECSVEAAAAIASRDQVTPARWMADAAATEAAAQCGVTALDLTVGKDEAGTLAAMIHRVSVERALQVRRGEPTWMCADGRGCPTTK